MRPSLDMSRIGGWGETVTPNRAQLREAAQKKAAAAAAYVEQTRARVVVDMEKIEKRVLDSALSGDASNAVRNLRSAAGRIVLTRNNFEEVPRKMTGAVRRGLARAIRKGVANPLATV